MKSIQEHYPDELSHCYGCGTKNEFGHQIKSYWDGDQTIAQYIPKPYHTAIPGFVYGGLLASLIDCHGTGSASLAAYRAENREPGSMPALRFVTASLEISYLKPTLLGPVLTLHGTILEVKGRKVITEIRVMVNSEITVKGKVVAVQVPESFFK